MFCLFTLLAFLKVGVTLELSVEEKQRAAVIKEAAEDIPHILLGWVFWVLEQKNKSRIITFVPGAWMC